MAIGNLCANVEVRQVGQSNVGKFNLAMNERFKKQDGTVGEATEYLTCEVWGKDAFYPYLVKGQLVYLEGSIRTESWEDQNGQKHYSTKCRVQTIQLLGPKPQQQAAQPAQQPAWSASTAPPQPQYQPPYGAVAQPPKPQAPTQQQLDPNEYPGDLPF